MPSEIEFARIPQFNTLCGEITLNRPDKGNALTMPMLGRLLEIITEIQRDPEIRVVIVRARGRFFCTGADIGAWSGLSPHEMARDWILPGIDVFERLAALPQPVIAAVSGHALGGGLELAMSADLRIAVESAKFGLPEVTLGMVSGWTGIGRLAEFIGHARARHLALLGSPITAAQALDWGLVTALAEDACEMNRQLDTWIERLGSNGPVAMALTKGILANLHKDLRQHSAAAAAQALATGDCAEGVLAFREKRKPVYRNR